MRTTNRASQAEKNGLLGIDSISTLIEFFLRNMQCFSLFVLPSMEAESELKSASYIDDASAS